MALRSPLLHQAAACALVAALAACSSATQSSRAAQDRSILSSDEIQTVAATTAHEAVSRLRPEWLRRRGRISIQNPGAGEVVVYVDDVRFGGPESLRSIRVESVLQMERLDASDATTRFGTGHAGGAILVRTQ